MTTGIKLYRTCPFCPSGHGDMAVDTDAIINWLLTNHYGARGANHDVHPAGETLGFNPDSSRNSACDHLIMASHCSMLVAEAFPVRRYIDETTINYEHRWFKAQGTEVRSEYSYFPFWGYEWDGQWYPNFGNLVMLHADKWMASTTHDSQQLALRVGGFAQYVERPGDFFRDLPRRYEEWTRDIAQ